ncbi:MAG: TldD/PmbA family protein [Acidobacteriota bacterium]
MANELNKQLASELAYEAVKNGASAAEVVIKQRTEFSVGVRLGEVETLQQSTDRGLGLRVLLDGKQASVSGSDFRKDALTELVQQAIALVRVTSPDDNIGLPDSKAFAQTIEDLDLYDEAIVNLATEQKIEMALRAEQAARDSSPLIVNFEGGGVDTSVGSLILANSLGFAGAYRGTSFSIASVPVASENGQMQGAYWYDVKRQLADVDLPENIGRIAAQRTLRKLGARAVATQNVPVVFEQNIARTLMSYVFQAASGEAIFRKSSFFVGQLGEKVADEKVTVIDDGQLIRGLGSRPFDAEGLPTRKTVVIKNGILENYLLDTYTARKLGMQSTGNASRGLVGALGVEAGNFYLEPGRYSPNEIIGAVSKGFLVTDVLGFGVNTVTGDYSQSASGIWIENGELTFPVQGVTIAGNLKDMLQAIEMIGNDLQFRGNITSPTVLIGRMTLSA